MCLTTNGKTVSFPKDYLLLPRFPIIKLEKKIEFPHLPSSNIILNYFTKTPPVTEFTDFWLGLAPAHKFLALRRRHQVNSIRSWPKRSDRCVFETLAFVDTPEALTNLVVVVATLDGFVLWWLKQQKTRLIT